MSSKWSFSLWSLQHVRFISRPLDLSSVASFPHQHHSCSLRLFLSPCGKICVICLPCFFSATRNSVFYIMIPWHLSTSRKLYSQKRKTCPQRQLCRLEPLRKEAIAVPPPITHIVHPSLWTLTSKSSPYLVHTAQSLLGQFSTTLTLLPLSPRTRIWPRHRYGSLSSEGTLL